MAGRSSHSVTMPVVTSSKQNVTLLIIYINVVLYATCYQMQRPLEPFLVDKLLTSGDSVKEYAKLQSFFSVMQTVGSFFSGILVDKFGVKGGFIVSFLGSAACYALLSESTSLSILYMSKIPSIFQAGFLCAQVGVTQVTGSGTDRVIALGRLTMSYTIGSVIGPAVGGMLGATGDYYYGAKLAVAGSLLSILLTLLMPTPDTTQSTQIPINSTSRDESDDSDPMLTKDNNLSSSSLSQEKDKEEGFTKSEATVVSVVHTVWLFLTTKVTTSVANAMAQAAFPLIMKNTYGLQEQSMGFTMSLMSAVNAVVNGVFLGPIVALGGGDLCSLIGKAVAIMGILSAAQAVAAIPSLSAISWQGGVGEYLTLTFMLSMVQYVLATTITSESTSRVNDNAKGTLLGLEHSLFAAARVFTPQLGVSLLEGGGVTAVSGACAAVFFSVYVLWHSFIDGQQTSKKQGSSKQPLKIDGEGKKK